MITLNVKGSKHGEVTLNLPTTLNEITEEYIKSVTEHILVAPNYSLVGTIFREKLSTILLSARRKNKDAGISVIPVFIKCGNTEDSFIKNLTLKTKIVISPSDIMLGHHVTAPNNLLTINNFVEVTEGDTSLYQKTNEINKECYFIEFKLVPNCNIHGAYLDNTESISNPYIIKK